ncbi:MAG TPA: class I SAM-dependent methyltransferase [Anaerolineae bacterium]|nr:class I SAM-dependent methyltransferase [Anaerolineae bacterium]
MTTQLTPAEWDSQYSRQAGWTRPTRTYLYRQASLARARRVLDVGSGTGTVTEEIAESTIGRVTGIDIDPEMVRFASGRGGRAAYQAGDAHALPFADGLFDLTVCHFVLLWCRDPRQVAGEMLRVTRAGGTVLVCAEPDYGGRIDYPDLPVGQWQARVLREEGADPCVGRKLRCLFAAPLLRRLEVGVIPGLWDPETLRREFDAEWSLWERSISGHVAAEEMAEVKAADWAATQSGERLVFMPVFYALAQRR